jgi:hypothetical protein
MNLTAKYQPQRNQYWPEVEQFFGSLPPGLVPLAVFLKNNLATFFSDTGRFEDILRREQDPPHLYLHFWLLDDLQLPTSAHRTALERDLFLATVFNVAAVFTHQTILDESSNFDATFQFLAQTLTQRADVLLARQFPGESVFWQHHQIYWAEYIEASLPTADRSEASLWDRPVGPTAELTAAKLAYTKIPMAAVVIAAGQAAALPQLEEMMDRLNFIRQILADISTLRRDLARRRLTYPLARMLAEAGLEPHQSVEPARLLGALVLSGMVGQICEECLAALAECRATATALSLPTFNRYFDIVEDLVDEVSRLFDIKAKPGASSARSDSTFGIRARAPARTLALADSARGAGDEFRTPKVHQQMDLDEKGNSSESPRRIFFAPAVDTVSKVIEMAEGYLLADPTFRESWEVQRRGAFGVPGMTAKAFPAGLIVEILCRHGHDLAAAVDEIFRTLQATDFRYFDFPGMPPDADDVGLLLRLFPYSPHQAAHREILQTPLCWLGENVEQSGQIPVWFIRQAGYHPPAGQPLALWGQTCLTVEANLLLGLLAYDETGYQALIELSARTILERWINQGLSATRHYVPLYSLWVGFELLARLAAGPLRPTLLDRLDRAAQSLTERLAMETNRVSLSPQDAAFLTLACLSAGSPEAAKDLFKPRWIDILCQSQRYDGSWASEPLYGTPTRGEFAAWYASRPMTTAFCYHALKTHQAIKM